MFDFHITVHARANEPACTLPVSFEDACERLAALPRMYCEPDGSFVWVADQTAEPDSAWQVDGNLFDGPNGLAYVELKGRCPRVEFQRLLAACGRDTAPLAIQQVREGVWLEEAEFLAIFAESN